MVNAMLRMRRRGGVNARYYNYRAHQLGKVLVKRIGTVLMWSVVLVAGAWLPGCASDDAGATKNSIEESKQVAPHMAKVWGDPNEPIVFVEKDWDIENMTLHDLKTMSAEEIYSLTPTQLQKLKDRAPEDKSLSEQEWQSIIKTMQKYHPIEWRFAKIEYYVKYNQCQVAELALGGYQQVLYFTDDFIENNPKHFPQQKDSTIYKGPRYNIEKYLDGYRYTDRELLGDFICLNDYKEQSYKNLYYAPKLAFVLPQICNVYVTVLAQHARAWPECKAENGEYKHYAQYDGSDYFCRLNSVLIDSSVTCKTIINNINTKGD